MKRCCLSALGLSMFAVSMVLTSGEATIKAWVDDGTVPANNKCGRLSISLHGFHEVPHQAPQEMCPGFGASDVSEAHGRRFAV